MFGGCLVYIDDKPTVLITEDTAYVKVHPSLDGLLGGAVKAPPYPGARDHYVLDLDDADLVLEAALAILPHLEVPRPRPRPGNRKDVPPKGGVRPEAALKTASGGGPSPAGTVPKGSASEASPEKTPSGSRTAGKARRRTGPR
jgi:hypothetical protein